MASQTVMTFCSSFTPKLATFNSPTPTLLPLPPPRSFSCSSSLPTPCLKASYGEIRVRQTSRDFKCYASTNATSNPGVPQHIPVLWQDVPGGENDEKMMKQGQSAVDEYNKTAVTKIIFDRVLKVQGRVTDGVSYRLFIKVQEGTETRFYEALVSFGQPVTPVDIKPAGLLG